MKGRLFAALVAVVVGGGLVAGCGGGSSQLSKAAYEQKLQGVGKDLQTAFQGVNFTNPSSLDALSKQVAKAEDAAKKAADDLDGITPPKDAEADNAKIVKALRVIGDDMDKLKKAAAKGDQTLAGQAARDLQGSSALQDAQTASNDLKKKGYKIGVLGG